MTENLRHQNTETKIGRKTSVIATLMGGAIRGGEYPEEILDALFV